jgi:replication-associated recombination protein RarA
MVWYEEYDFVSNPFTIKPQEGFDEFFGQQEIIKKLIENIESEEISIVYGPYGTGKTTIMKGIIEEYKGARKVAYYNAFTSEKIIDFEDILVRAGSRISTFFGIKSKGVILLLDESQNLMKKDFENLLYYYNEGYFKSVILVTSKKDFQFSKEIKEETGKNVFELKMMIHKEAVSLVKQRLEGVELLNENMVKKILDKSLTPREFLMNCEHACKNTVERGSEEVEDEDIKEL